MLGLLILPAGQVLLPNSVAQIALSNGKTSHLKEGDVVACVPRRWSAGSTSLLTLAGDVSTDDEEGDENLEADMQDIMKTEEGNFKTSSTDDAVSITLYGWGCSAKVLRISSIQSESTSLFTLDVQSRVKIKGSKEVDVNKAATVNVETVIEPKMKSTQANQQIVTYLQDVCAAVLNIPVDQGSLISTLQVAERLKALNKKMTISSASVMADAIIGACIVSSPQEKMLVLRLADPRIRCQVVIRILARHMSQRGELLDVKKLMEKNATISQREDFLRKQLVAIQQQLAKLRPSYNFQRRSKASVPEDDPDPLDEPAILRKRLDANKHMSPASKSAAITELRRLKNISPHSAEYSVILTYVDWLVSLPWDRQADVDWSSNFMRRAQDQLDHDHFGMLKIKRRLMEYLAVEKLKYDISQDSVSTLKDIEQTGASAGPSKLIAKADNSSKTRSPILLLAGPPGVGKTSIARSLAKAMNRPFHRISLGGIRDESQIRGHRRTYVGALPGVLVDALKKAQVSNPVILLDEIDKISSISNSGNPQAALLEVTDPEQNFSFLDHYINTPLDLSKVIFIATANDIDDIPEALLDRMELIRLQGYTASEKLKIARDHLLPEQISQHALTPDLIQISDSVILDVIQGWTHESGVRSLNRTLASICRYKASQYAQTKHHSSGDNNYASLVDSKDLEQILGTRYVEENGELENRVGIARGLAYTGSGNGATLFIESSKYPGRGKLRLSGSIQDVMRESCELALSWIKANAGRLGLSNYNSSDTFDNLDIHIHFPAGSVKKDGPSAGVAIVAAVTSLLRDQSIDSRTCMTGEITLRGAVQAVGGVREKVTAAIRAGMQRVILPEGCRGDAERDLDSEARAKILIHFVSTIEQALEMLFAGLHFSRPVAIITMPERSSHL